VDFGEQLLIEYDAWLSRQALAQRTQAAYLRWARELVEHLAVAGELEAFVSPAGDDDRRALVSDWRRRLVDRRLAPSTVNLALAAATSLLDSRRCAAHKCDGSRSTPRTRGHSRTSSCAHCSARPIASHPAGIAR